MTAPSTTPTDDAVFAAAPAAAPAAPAAAPAAPAPAVVEPTVEPAVVEPSAEVAVAEPAAEVAVPDGPKPWTHETMEFRGDTLEIRKPTQQALSGFSLASSKYVDMQVKNDVFGLFLVRHLSGESYGRVMSRLMDPDDADYDTETIGELVKGLVETAVPEAVAAADQG